ncbi:hypothetical protein [Providencia huaxiensis]|uniref:hypothetical protein n=1 Tax=Providencia huaxiensis TaxID=2027290 RepID=UPI0034DD5621
MYQQSPKPGDGQIFHEEFVRYYLPKDLPEKFDKVIHSWDMTFKDSDGTDYVVGQVWGKKDANAYLLYQIRKRMSFTQTKDAVKLLAGKIPRKGAVSWWKTKPMALQLSTLLNHRYQD